MPAFIHQRAEHLLAKNPSMGKGTAFAIATQQSHRLGKSPKGYGTAEGRREAKVKYDKPKKEYVKTPNPGGLDSPKLAHDLEKLSVSGIWLQRKTLGALKKGKESGKLTSQRLADFVRRRHEAAYRLGKKVPRLPPDAGPLAGLEGGPHPNLRRMWKNETVASYVDPDGSILESLLDRNAFKGASIMAIGSPKIEGKPKEARVTLGSALVGIMKQAGSGDDPYLLDQVRKEPKDRIKKAVAPNPKYRVKQAMGAESLNVKMAGVTSALKALSPSMQRVLKGGAIGAAGGAALGAARAEPGSRLSGALKGGALGGAAGSAMGWAAPRYAAGRAGGLTARQAAGSVIEDAGVHAAGLGRRVSGRMPRAGTLPAISKSRVTRKVPMAGLASAAERTTGAFSPMAKRNLTPTAERVTGAFSPMAKRAFAVSQYSGTLGEGKFNNYASGQVPFRNPMLRNAGASNEELAMAQKAMRKRDKGWVPLMKESAMLDELAKLNSVSSPQAALSSSQQVGKPRKSPLHGNSIQQTAKPVGFGTPAPGTTKPGVI